VISVVDLLGASALAAGELADWAGLATNLTQHQDALSQFLWSRFSATGQAVLTNYVGSGAEPELVQVTLVQELNGIISSGPIYQAQHFASVALSPETRGLLALNPQGDLLIRLNRWLLSDAYPRAVPRPGSLSASVNQRFYRAFRNTGN